MKTTTCRECGITVEYTFKKPDRCPEHAKIHAMLMDRLYHAQYNSDHPEARRRYRNKHGVRRVHNEQMCSLCQHLSWCSEHVMSGAPLPCAPASGLVDCRAELAIDPLSRRTAFVLELA
jgi:hypothetical protein